MNPVASQILVLRTKLAERPEPKLELVVAFLISQLTVLGHFRTTLTSGSQASYISSLLHVVVCLVKFLVYY